MRVRMSGYRPPSTEPRGKWARAIHAKRRSDGISQTGAFEVLGERLGLGPKSRAAYVAIDLGLRQPTEAEAAVLAEWLGAYPSDDMERSGRDDTPPDLSALLAKLDRQAEVIDRLAAAIELLMADRTPPPVPDRALADIQAAEEAAARERPQTTSRRRRSDPEHRSSGQRQAAQEGETA